MNAEKVSLIPEKCETKLGWARVDIKKLTFTSALGNEHREESDKAQRRLLKVFELEGCRRLEPENFIDATISLDSLVNALKRSGLSLGDFGEICALGRTDPRHIVHLSLDHDLQCLNGLQRVRAAESFLPNNDKWWLVTLHDESAIARLNDPSAFRRELYEAYQHEHEYTDGIIFRNILRYSKVLDHNNEQKWWARLSPTKQKDLKQLLSFKNRKLRKAFLDLVDIPGLWPPIQLGVLHRFHGLRCNEIMLNYLVHIKESWSMLVPESYWYSADSQTVAILELLAPAISTTDLQDVESAMLKGLLFPSLNDVDARRAILQSIRRFEGLIPSLKTFFENQKFLEPCSQILKDLIGVPLKKSLWKEYKANFYSVGCLPGSRNETMQSYFNTQATSHESKKVECKYAFLQLFLFCFRNFPKMSIFSPRLEGRSRDKKKSGVDFGTDSQYHDPGSWHNLAVLAHNLGFRTENIKTLAERDSDEMRTIQFLKSVRPNSHTDMTRHVLSVTEILKDISEPRAVPSTAPRFTVDEDVLWPKAKRCGRPHDDDHEKDQPWLVIDLFYSPVMAGKEVTPLYVKRQTILAFFRKQIDQIKTFYPDLSQLPDAVIRLETEQAAWRRQGKVVEDVEVTVTSSKAEASDQGHQRMGDDSRLRKDLIDSRTQIVDLHNQVSRLQAELKSEKESKDLAVRNYHVVMDELAESRRSFEGRRHAVWNFQAHPANFDVNEVFSGFQSFWYNHDMSQIRSNAAENFPDAVSVQILKRATPGFCSISIVCQKETGRLEALKEYISRYEPASTQLWIVMKQAEYLTKHMITSSMETSLQHQAHAFFCATEDTFNEFFPTYVHYMISTGEITVNMWDAPEPSESQNEKASKASQPMVKKATKRPHESLEQRGGKLDKHLISSEAAAAFEVKQSRPSMKQAGAEQSSSQRTGKGPQRVTSKIADRKVIQREKPNSSKAATSNIPKKSEQI